MLSNGSRHYIGLGKMTNRDDGEAVACDFAEPCAGYATLTRQLAEAQGYATRLATSLWDKHWKQDAPEWQPLPDLIGLLTQIDNACAGLVRPPSPTDAPGVTEKKDDKPFAWYYELGHKIKGKEYDHWVKHLSFEKPNVPESSIRNLKPLYD